MSDDFLTREELQDAISTLKKAVNEQIEKVNSRLDMLIQPPEPEPEPEPKPEPEPEPEPEPTPAQDEEDKKEENDDDFY